jgi:hypothetical protein
MIETTLHVSSVGHTQNINHIQGLSNANWGILNIVAWNLQLIYWLELTIPDGDRANWRKIWARILVASQLCIHGLNFLAKQLRCHIYGRMATLQVQHPGENLQSYSIMRLGVRWWGTVAWGGMALSRNSMAMDITTGTADSAFNSGTAANCQYWLCVTVCWQNDHHACSYMA